MSVKYDSFIELTPGYESVVDISSDSRNADFWSRYIVNDDMVTAVRLLSKSLRPDDPAEDVWHYWIKGSYGTGKTYSAIVIKHLLQDDYSLVENFLTKNKLFADVKDKFLSVRKKGPFYVKFRSGECKQLDTSNKFLFQIEKSVRDILAENGFSYTGKNSLVESVQKTVKSFKPTLAQYFDNGEFPEYWSTYDSFEDFYSDVENGDITACSSAQEILQSMNIGLATDLDTFKAWIKDVFDGNQVLAKTGMFIIWDEFTEYIRSNDLDIIQQLSLFSKEVPFFIIYVMHEYPGVFSENVTAGLGKADARFHKIDVSLSEKTTLKLIGESIITRDGMKDNWADICDDLYSSISGSVHAFMGDPGSDLDSNTLKKIFPIHPMTVNLVSKVAGLAPSNRSIFEFLKSNGDDGFRAYIHNNGQFDWKWVTPDYLWEYFFVNNFSGKKTLTKMAEDALKHYTKVKSQISDERMLRVFKGAMLLLATIGSGHSLKKSKGSKGIQATEKTLCDCFCGMLTKDEVSSYLKILSADPLNVLVLAPDIHEGARIELPYSGTGGELDAEIERLKKDNPLLDGGAQESEHRARTENVASIVGMARALEDNCSCLHDNTERILEMEKALLSELTAAHVHFHRNGCEPRIPGNISLSLSGIDGEALLHRLDLRGICVSTGSACDSVNTQISHVLRAISLDEKLAKGTIRISLGKNNTAEEAGIIGKEIVKILNGR